MNAQHALLAAFDGHDAERIRAALNAGADVRGPINGKPAVDWLLEEYTRSDRLPDCLRLLMESGATVSDPVLMPVLLDEYDGVIRTARAHATLSVHRTSLNSSFTSLSQSVSDFTAAVTWHLLSAFMPDLPRKSETPENAK